jgi:hypothetical protein
MAPRIIPTEHGIDMYRKMKCRCDVCRNAARDMRAKYRPLSDSKKIRLDPQPLIDKLIATNQLYEVHQSKWQGWLEKGIDIYWADFWCIKFGYHPVEIFGNAFYQGCFDEERAA